MPLLAAADPVIVVALVAIGLLVAVIAVALLVITRALKQVSARMAAIVAAAEQPPAEVGQAEDVLKAINADLRRGEELLDQPDGPEDAERGSG